MVHSLTRLVYSTALRIFIFILFFSCYFPQLKSPHLLPSTFQNAPFSTTQGSDSKEPFQSIMISFSSDFLITVISIICLVINRMALWSLLKCTVTQGQSSEEGTGSCISQTITINQKLHISQRSHTPVLLGLSLRTHSIDEYREAEERCHCSHIYKS